MTLPRTYRGRMGDLWFWTLGWPRRSLVTVWWYEKRLIEIYFLEPSFPVRD